MLLTEGPRRPAGVGIRIAVPAPVGAAVIRPDIAHLHAGTAFAHAAMRKLPERDTIRRTERFQGHAARPLNPVGRKVFPRRARLQAQPVLARDAA